jgi:hypothetical protein
MSGLPITRESPKSRLLEPVKQLRAFYYLMLPRQPDICEEVVVEPGQALAPTPENPILRSPRRRGDTPKWC